MPIAWTPDLSGRFSVLTITDPYTFDDWRAAHLEMIESPMYQTHRAVLVDRTHAAPATTAFVNAITEFFESHRAHVARRAAVVVSDDTAYGMARMTQMKADERSPHMKIRVFRAMDEALTWLSEGDD
jgi:hypothetical protein